MEMLTKENLLGRQKLLPLQFPDMSFPHLRREPGFLKKGSSPLTPRLGKKINRLALSFLGCFGFPWPFLNKDFP